jgi:hypothetical protein
VRCAKLQDEPQMGLSPRMLPKSKALGRVVQYPSAYSGTYSLIMCFAVCLCHSSSLAFGPKSLLLRLVGPNGGLLVISQRPQAIPNRSTYVREHVFGKASMTLDLQECLITSLGKTSQRPHMLDSFPRQLPRRQRITIRCGISARFCRSTGGAWNRAR